MISFILSNFLLIKSNITTFKLLIMLWMQATIFMSESNIIRALSTNVRSICYVLCCSYYVVSYRVYAFELSLLPIVMILLSTNASPSFFFSNRYVRLKNKKGKKMFIRQPMGMVKCISFNYKKYNLLIFFIWYNDH